MCNELITSSPLGKYLLQGRNEGDKGGKIPRAPNHYGGAKSPNNVTSTFFNTVHLLPEDLRFKHGGAKLASCSGRHLTSLRPWLAEVIFASTTLAGFSESLRFKQWFSTFFRSRTALFFYSRCVPPHHLFQNNLICPNV